MDIDACVGTSGTWPLPIEGGQMDVEGTYLGCASSRARRHDPRAHPNGPGMAPVRRCSACRWSEFRIFREETGGAPVDDKPYLVHFSGCSVLMGEKSRFRFEEMLTAREVIEIMTTRRSGKAYLSVPAGRVLAQAAAFDKGALKEAYDARLVA